MNLFRVVKASITTQEAAQTYEIDVNHYDMALCPFRNDRRPSLLFQNLPLGAEKRCDHYGHTVLCLLKAK